MPRRVAVTRITIEYACDGQTFTMTVNDPSTIDSIVLSERDLHRLRSKQADLAALHPPQAPKVVDHRFNPSAEGAALKLKSDTHPPLPISISRGGTTDIRSVDDRSLWWHTSGCAWIHPEGET